MTDIYKDKLDQSYDIMKEIFNFPADLSHERRNGSHINRSKLIF